MQAQQTQVFAFGDDCIDGQPCPAVAAGWSPNTNDASLSVAEQFDVVVKRRYDLDEGTLPRSVAESCWNQAIAEIRQTMEKYRDSDPAHFSYLDESAEVGEEIESALF